MTEERLVEAIPLADGIDDARRGLQIQHQRARAELQRRIDQQHVIGMPQRQRAGDAD